MQPDLDHFWPAFEFRFDGGWFAWWDAGGEFYAGEWEWFEDEWPRAEWRKHRYQRRKAWKRAAYKAHCVSDGHNEDDRAKFGA